VKYNCYCRFVLPDYEKLAFFDVEKHPDLDKQGLFWTGWEDGELLRLKADTEEGAALIDKKKPTVILIHGVVNGSYPHGDTGFWVDKSWAQGDDFLDGYDGASVNLCRLWQDLGYNVGYFNYSRFADEGGGGSQVEDIMAVATAAYPIECKIWGTDGVNGTQYRKPDGSYSEKDALNFSITETFAGEYMRAVKLLPDFEGEEVQFIGHSMGGLLANTSAYLLGELADAGRIDKKFLPGRLTLLDSYLGSSGIATQISRNPGSFVKENGKGMTVGWTGKEFPLNENEERDSLISMYNNLKKLDERGVAIEYYYNSRKAVSIVGVTGKWLFERMGEFAACAEILPGFLGGDLMTKSHEMILTWYLVSRMGAPAVTDEWNEETGEYSPAINASTPSAVVKSLKGVRFLHFGGTDTLNPDDDFFIVMLDKKGDDGWRF